MRLARIVVMALLGIVLVSTVACDSDPIPYYPPLPPSPTPTPIPLTPTPTPSQEELAYTSVRDEIQNAITSYTAIGRLAPTGIGYVMVEACQSSLWRI